MITVEIPKKELLRQLPEKAGYALMQWLDEMPNTFRFEALPLQTNIEVVEEGHPELWRALTPKEKTIFMTLYRRGKVSRQVLEGLVNIDEDSMVMTSNIVDVHIKNLRKKLEKLQTPFRLFTIRAGFGMQGRFLLKEFSKKQIHVPNSN